jgi:hypothetical protein
LLCGGVHLRLRRVAAKAGVDLLPRVSVQDRSQLSGGILVRPGNDVDDGHGIEVGEELRHTGVLCRQSRDACHHFERFDGLARVFKAIRPLTDSDENRLPLLFHHSS